MMAHFQGRNYSPRTIIKRSVTVNMIIDTWYTEILGEKRVGVESYQPHKTTLLLSQRFQDDRQANNPLTYAMPLTRST